MASFGVRLAQSPNFLSVFPPRGASPDLASDDLEGPGHSGFISGGPEDLLHTRPRPGGGVPASRRAPACSPVSLGLRGPRLVSGPRHRAMLLIFAHLGRFLTKDVPSEDSYSQAECNSPGTSGRWSVPPLGLQSSYREESDTLSGSLGQSYWLRPGLVRTAGEAGLRGGHSYIPAIGVRLRGGGT